MIALIAVDKRDHRDALYNEGGHMTCYEVMN
jgi:hypothetical protein